MIKIVNYQLSKNLYETIPRIHININYSLNIYFYKLTFIQIFRKQYLSIPKNNINIFYHNL